MRTDIGKHDCRTASTSSRCARSPASVWQTRGRRRNSWKMNSAETSHKHWKLKARWYWPGGGPLQRDAILSLSGPHNLGAKKLYNCDYREIDLGESIILPGL